VKDETIVALFGIGCSTLLGIIALIQRIDTALFMAVGSAIGGIVAWVYKGRKKERQPSGTT